MTSEKASKKDKNQNIQVFVRLRPLNQRERDIKSLGVLEVVNNREVVVRQSQQTTHTKKFTFDRAFGPNAKQVEVYQQVVSPLIEEVLAGYNCTVFAYGQTGTGKTHTMVGEHTGVDTDWQSDPLAGIIPRALSQLYDELRLSNTEYTVRVSYLELYNEELFDLLSTSEDNSKLRIYEDITRKGSNIVNGLEEITVNNKNEVYKIMAQGQERKKVASTLMNAQSSGHPNLNGNPTILFRSHTVFTIVVHMKDNGQEGEELVKIGKLNLVDLAGSENISKAGSDNPTKKERARECVNINQSLLTLGRVITALVERHPHIPYRESKLTRILQESLGGRTKTSIIATVSPGHKDLEETMSTLEYANRAKNIQNKPEINQKMTKRAILKEYAEEIDRLKRDLTACRDKNGVYLANETYAEMILKDEQHKKEIQELLLKKRAMEEEMAKADKLFSNISNTLEEKMSELSVTKNKLNSTKTQLVNTHHVLESTKQRMLEEAHVAERQAATEAVLAQQARQLVATADVINTHVRSLHDTVDKRRSVESTNLKATRTYREVSSQQRAHITSSANHFTRTLVEALNGLHTALENFASTSTLSIQENKSKLEEVMNSMVETMEQIKSIADQSQSGLIESTSAHRSQVQSAMESYQRAVQSMLTSLLHSFGNCVQSAQDQKVAASVASVVDKCHTSALARVTSLQRTYAAFSERAAACDRKRTEAARAQRELMRAYRDSMRAHSEKQTGRVNAAIAELQEDQAQIQVHLSQELSDIETERRETELRLQRWAQQEMEHFQRRLQEHVRAETEAIETRLSKKARDIEIELSERSSRVSRQVAYYRSLLEVEAEKLEKEAEELETEEHQLRDAEAAGEESRDTLARYGKEFDEGASAISTGMEVFSRNVVEVVQHSFNELLRTLLLAKEQIEKDGLAIVQENEVTSQQFVNCSDTALANYLNSNKDIMDAIIGAIEAKNTANISTLTTVIAASSTQLSSTTSHVAAHGARVQGLAGQVTRFQEQLVEAVERHEDLEGRYLSEEYKVYSPTGHTPSRQEYRYPRMLAATSPRDTILAKFRAARRHQDDDCILLESDPESRAASDCESSLSEDSAHFAVPSPPTHAQPSPPAHAQPRHILKSTSENDIVYAVKQTQDHHQGKENADRSISYKKPSKLRAPSYNKKPLFERNGL